MGEYNIQEYSGGGCLTPTSAEMQLAYSTVPADKAGRRCISSSQRRPGDKLPKANYDDFYLRGTKRISCFTYLLWKWPFVMRDVCICKFKSLCYNHLWICMRYHVQRLLEENQNKSDIQLVGWFLWHIKPCRLFNAKCIFIQINSFISDNSV